MTQLDEIQTSAEQLQKIRLLSDGELYQMACEFVKKHGTINSRKQVVSLVAHTQSWNDIEGFVNKQANREWGNQQKYTGYKEFFQNLKKDLSLLRNRVKKEWFPPSPERDTKAWVNHFAILVVREFLQHLEAENMYRNPKY